MVFSYFINFAEANNTINDNEIAFDKDKWLEKKGNYYPYRNEMLDSVLLSSFVRSLDKKEIIQQLGEPSYYRDNKNYLYYLIKKKTLLGIWTLHTKTLVIKLKDGETVDWIKVHE